MGSEVPSPSMSNDEPHPDNGPDEEGLVRAPEEVLRAGVTRGQSTLTHWLRK